jgi:hypothetical protein
MRRDSRDPGKGESRISPLLQPWPSRNEKRDRSQRLGDAKQNAQLLRIADACEALHGLLPSRQVNEARHDSGRCYQHRRDPIKTLSLPYVPRPPLSESTTSDDERGNGDSAHLRRAGNSLRRPQVGFRATYRNRLIGKN